METKRYKLSEISLNVTDGEHGTIKDDNNGKYFLLSCKNIKNGLINITPNERIINEESFNKVQKRIRLEKNDVLITTVGTIGEMAIIETNDINYCFQRSVGIIKPNIEIVNPHYLYYSLKNETKQISTLIKGAVQKCLFINDMKTIEIDLPNMKVQNKITKILNNIDKKIKLNNEINNNLYELMRIKFNNYVDNIEEYKESVLSKIANYKNGLAMQKFRPINEIGLPVIKIKEMNSGISSETEKCKSDIDDEVVINDGDVLFAWSGTLCMSIWCEGKAGLNQHIFKVTSDKYPKWFYYFWTLKYLDNFIEIAAGKATTMGHIKRTELDKAVVKIPNDKSIDEMDRIFTPMLNKYINNSIENRNLIKLRDTLLPKLMNGEIDLDSIDI